MEGIKQRLADMLEWDNPTPRHVLSVRLGICDRRVRKYIEELREDDTLDYVIVSSSQGKGYYKTKDPEKIRLFTDEMQRRARHTFRSISHSVKLLRRQEDTTKELEEVDDGQN